jgi:hypothetical protein
LGGGFWKFESTPTQEFLTRYARKKIYPAPENGGRKIPQPKAKQLKKTNKISLKKNARKNPGESAGTLSRPNVVKNVYPKILAVLVIIWIAVGSIMEISRDFITSSWRDVFVIGEIIWLAAIFVLSIYILVNAIKERKERKK